MVENFSLDYERKLPEISSLLKLSIYHEDNENLSGFVTGAPRLVGGLTYVLKMAQNIGSSQGGGGEIGLSGASEDFRWDGSYSFQTIHDSPLVAQKLGYDGSAPQHQIRLNLGYTLDNWEADLHGQFATGTDMLRLTTVLQPVQAGAFYSLGARLGYAIAIGTTLSLSGTNLTRGVTNESAYPAVERQFTLNLAQRF